MERLPKLELVASFGVGYDNIDTSYAAAHGITVTNTPDVLTEEVADTTLGLLLCTVREFPQAERYLRAGRWMQAAYPLTRRRSATARWASWDWVESGRRSLGGSTPSACRWCITAALRSRMFRIGTTGASSAWPATSIR